MKRTVFVDVVAGAAGDMLLAALIDAGADENAVYEAVEAVIPDRFRVTTEEVIRGGLRARGLRLEPIGQAIVSPASSRTAEDLIRLVEKATLAPSIRTRAVAVLRALAMAEAAVHGAPRGLVGGQALHELGDDDTLIDVVGIAAALESLGIDSMMVSSVPTAIGRSGSALPGHGAVPLPGPATLHLLRGFDLRPAPGHAERVTPTAAAVFVALGHPSPHIPSMRLEAVGYGAGTRDPGDEPNIVRVLVGFAEVDAIAPTMELVVLEANLDDLSPELVADAAVALMDAGALDAWVVGAQMKKGRPGVILSALCAPAVAPAVRRAFFTASSTFGVRSHSVSRVALDREIVTFQMPGGSIRAKIGTLDGKVVSVKAEHDDVAAVARSTGRPVREVHEEAMAAVRASTHAPPEDRR